MTTQEVLSEIKKLGSEQTKKVLSKHGAPEPFYGVKVADLKTIQKKIKRDQELALQLYDTGISDAMYLAGLIAEPQKMTKEQLQSWVEKATWYMLSEYTVAWVAAESKYGWELALKWIENSSEKIASSGWSTLASIVMITPDKDLDTNELQMLLNRVVEKIHSSPGRVRYAMNGFVIALGSAVAELTNAAVEAAKEIGVVTVDMGGTACKVPSAIQYIDKVAKKGYIGKKKKRAVC